ncbi:MAG: hypothetical protein BM557_11825 [Flavobacterium sp. MedPE-SWcel]|uniref:hypothetical protein n=1 Tax=uncultured Flavobacterium sp. TaxID=165435 RepID=UPI000921F0C5|nr:hypothetical protein [uncultured Flavobacterium sp.]OIQ15314.1 MAG: hypothetical protein BM557_11825 [Flavobacterium sp. MedPE-SWcel]
MKTITLFKVVSLCLLITILSSCSSDDETTPLLDNRSIVTSTNTDFLINYDGTVDLIVTGDFTITGDDILTFGAEESRGFVYSTSSNEAANSTNTIITQGNNPLTGYIEDLPSGNDYFIRGFFKMSDGTYFYGNEILASTDVDASVSRTITLEIESTPFFISQTEVTPTVNISNISKEIPTEIGYEYSVNNDFSNSITNTIEAYNGNNIQGVLLQANYSTEIITGLTPSTSYFFRPYAKYADNTITNGGTSIALFTTNN